MPLTKLWSSQRMSRGARLQGPIMEGLSPTTSSSENRKGGWCLDPTGGWALTRRTDRYVRAGRWAARDANDKDGNDGDVEALSAALTDPGCMATLRSLSLRRLSHLALKFCHIAATQPLPPPPHPLLLSLPGSALAREKQKQSSFMSEISIRCIRISQHAPSTFICNILLCFFLFKTTGL